jgi:hypothetical protein
MGEYEVAKPTCKSTVLRCKKSECVQDPIGLVRDWEQLYFLDAPTAQQKPVTEEDVVSRYRQNGSRAKVLGAVYTPPRVAIAVA